MPELPEVETVARQLQPLLAGQRIISLHIHDDKLFALDKSRIEGAHIGNVSRLGKQVVIALKKGNVDFWLCVHLRMTGRLIWQPQLKQERKHVRVTFQLDRGFLYFQDVRRFGTMVLLDDLAEAQPKGYDPLSKELNSRNLYTLLSGSRQPIKPWLLRQDRLVGLGNIYASEILYAAGIHPEKAAGDLTYEEVKKLFRSMRTILRLAIENCGTTFSDFQNANGEIGAYQEFLKVYNRSGEPCETCGADIERLVQQQRSGFFCPICQKESI